MSVTTYPFAGDERLIAGMALRGVESASPTFLRHAPDAGTILDCGCGPGSITAGIQSAKPRTHVVGLDADPAAIEAARARRTDDAARPRFVLGDMESAPFRAGTFDALHSSSTVMYATDVANVLRSFARLLAEDGIVCISDPDFARQSTGGGGRDVDDVQSRFLALQDAMGVRRSAPVDALRALEGAGLELVERGERRTDFRGPRGAAVVADTWLWTLSTERARAAASAADVDLAALRRDAEAVRADWATRPDASVTMWQIDLLARRRPGG